MCVCAFCEWCGSPPSWHGAALTWLRSRGCAHVASRVPGDGQCVPWPSRASGPSWSPCACLRHVQPDGCEETAALVDMYAPYESDVDPDSAGADI